MGLVAAETSAHRGRPTMRLGSSSRAKAKVGQPETPQLKTRFFDPWRRPAGPSMVVLVAEVVGAVERHELAGKLRRRRRRAVDQSVFETTVAAVICDLAHQHFIGVTSGVTVSRSKQVLTQRSVYRPAIFGEGFTRVLDHLAALGFLEQRMGFQSFPGTKGERTTIHPGPELLALLDGPDIDASDIGPALDQPTIILKATKEDREAGGEWMEYDPALPEVVEMQARLDRINRHLAEADLALIGQTETGKAVNLRDTVLRRVFTRGSFGSGGRLFGGFWQGMKKADRLDGILVGGEEVVELDYAQMAPRILYGLAGVRPTWDDAYLLPHLEMAPTYREGVKKLINAMLFAEGPLSRKPQGTRDLLPRISVQQLQARIEDRHRPIARHFGTSIGHELQFRESEILSEVLDRLNGVGVSVLPVHDALLVPASKAQEADKIMKEVFEERTGGSIHVRRTPCSNTHAACRRSP